MGKNKKRESSMGILWHASPPLHDALCALGQMASHMQRGGKRTATTKTRCADRINIKNSHGPTYSSECAKGYIKRVREKFQVFFLPSNGIGSWGEMIQLCCCCGKYLRAWIKDSRRFARKHMHKEREKSFHHQQKNTNTIERKVKKANPLRCRNVEEWAEMHKLRLSVCGAQ